MKNVDIRRKKTLMMTAIVLKIGRVSWTCRIGCIYREACLVASTAWWSPTRHRRWSCGRKTDAWWTSRSRGTSVSVVPDRCSLSRCPCSTREDTRARHTRRSDPAPRRAPCKSTFEVPASTCYHHHHHRHRRRHRHILIIISVSCFWSHRLERPYMTRGFQQRLCFPFPTKTLSYDSR